MKYLILLLVFALSFSQLQAQSISNNAIGLRFGENDGLGTEINYQRALSNTNRLEAALGWRNGNNYNGFKLTGLYQWVWALEGNFNWYAGAGGGLGAYSFDNAPNNTDSSDTFFFAAGNLGIEYNFDIPLLISLDFRPELGFSDFTDDLDFDIAFGVRYQF